MRARHPLLARQLRKAGIRADTPPTTAAEWEQFLSQVSEAYDQSDDDRYTLERSLMISSAEMQELYEDLRARSESELARSHEELARSLAVSRAALEASPDGVLVIGVERNVVIWNRKFVELWGVSGDVFATRDAEVVVEALQERVRDPAAFLASVSCLVADPTSSRHDDVELADGRILERAAVPILADDGQPSGRWLSFRDVTERRRAEESTRRLNVELRSRMDATLHALTLSERRFALLAEAGVIGVVSFDGRGELTSVNDAFLAMVGWSRAEFVSGQVRRADLLVPGQEAVEAAAAAGLRTTGIAQPFEKQYRRKDGSILPALVGAAMVHDGGGTAFIVDLSEQKQSQAKLSETQARFAALAGSGIIGIFTADQSGPIEDCNDAFLRMIGHSREDLEAGRLRWTDLTPREWTHTNERVGRQLCERGAAEPFEKEYLRKDGSRVSVLVGVATIDERRAITFVADLTEQKRAEEALRRTEHQLRQAQKMEAVGRLAGGVAHDFNNLLSVMLSHADLALSDLHPAEPLREDLDEIRKAAKRAADLTRQLLLFSRHGASETKVLDLNDVLSSTANMVRRILGEDIELVSAPAPRIGRVRVDPSHIEQVILNLVVNARDAMPKGGRLALRTEEAALTAREAEERGLPKGGAYVVLSAADTGCGMDQATQARIFEPFYTTKERGKGTGLGLSTVFGIVQQAGGAITVRSAPGHGATFDVYFPREDAEADVAPRSTPRPRRGTETVLLVEDDDAVRSVARNILRRQGYRVLEARSGGEALLLWEEAGHSIDVLLTDVVMPQMSGPELARRLVERRPSMRVVCMSGYTEDKVFRVSGELAFLQKPITPESLGAKIRDVLDAPRQQPRTPAPRVLD